MFLCVKSYFALFQLSVGEPLGVKECVYINQLLFIETECLIRNLCCTAELGALLSPGMCNAIKQSLTKTSTWLDLHIVGATFQQGVYFYLQRQG